MRKGNHRMKKKMKEEALRVISKIALQTAKEEVNSACMYLGYQPKMPEDALKLKRNKQMKE